MQSVILRFLVHSLATLGHWTAASATRSLKKTFVMSFYLVDAEEGREKHPLYDGIRQVPRNQHRMPDSNRQRAHQASLRQAIEPSELFQPAQDRRDAGSHSAD